MIRTASIEKLIFYSNDRIQEEDEEDAFRELLAHVVNDCEWKHKKWRCQFLRFSSMERRDVFGAHILLLVSFCHSVCVCVCLFVTALIRYIEDWYDYRQRNIALLIVHGCTVDYLSTSLDLIDTCNFNEIKSVLDAVITIMRRRWMIRSCWFRYLYSIRRVSFG